MLDASLASARGVVIAGRGTASPDAVVALADQLGWPVLADPLSGCRGRGAIAAFDSLLRTPFADRVRPEVVLRSGGMPASKVLGEWLDASEAHEVVIAPERWWPDPRHAADLLLDEVPVAPPDHEPVAEWRKAWEVADDMAQRVIDDVLAEHPLSEPAVARQLTRNLPPGAALVASSSMPVRDVEWYGTARTDLRHVANRGANGIDGVVSTAVGVAAAGVRTGLLIGDLAFLHDSNGLLGLADRDVHLTVVVVDNDGGGIFSFLPQRELLPHARYEQLFGTPHGLDLVALARAHGLEADEVTEQGQLDWRPGTRVLVVRGDRDENVAIHRALDAAVHAALTA